MLKVPVVKSEAYVTAPHSNVSLKSQANPSYFPPWPLYGLRVDEKLYQVQTWLKIA